MVFHVASLVLLSVTYSTDKNLLLAARALLSDIHPLVQGLYVDFRILLQVLKEL